MARSAQPPHQAPENTPPKAQPRPAQAALSSAKATLSSEKLTLSTSKLTSPPAKTTTAPQKNANLQPIGLQPLRIALVGYRSAPHVGGQGVYIRYLAEALSQQGHKVTVISGPPYPELTAGIALVKLPSLNLYEHPKPWAALRPKHFKHWSDLTEWWGKLSGSFAEPYCFGRRLAAHLKQHYQNYDVVHDNQTLCYSLLKCPLPVVATIHHPITRDKEQAIATAKNALHRWGAKRWYSFLTMQKKVAQALPAVVTVSGSSQNDIAHCFARSIERTQVIFNGIDTQHFQPKQLPQKRKQSLLAICSSDQPVKGLGVLLDAYALLLKSQPGALLTVIGKLDPHGANRKKLKKLGLENKIAFRQGLSNKEMVAAYNQATVFVCASLYEGFGLPIAEAMSCGTAVVTTDGGALAEVAGDGACVVPANNAQALAQALSNVLANPKLREQLEQKGRARALQCFSWQTVAKQYEEVYCQAIAPNLKPGLLDKNPPNSSQSTGSP